MRHVGPTPLLLLLLVSLACHGGASPTGESVSTAPDSAAFADLPPRTIAASLDGLASPVAPDALSGVEAHLAKREYWASETDEGLQAPNRAHDLRSYFDARGVSIEDRDAPKRTTLVELSLVGFGRAGSIADVPPGEVFHRGEGRTEIVRDSLGLVEWFENSSAGLEQGFTLNEKPGPGATIEEGLVLELAVSGARATLSGDSVQLATMAGRLLDYGKLAVFDANESTLSVRFELAGEDRIRIRVDDRGATYPIVVDPLITNVSDGGAFSNQGGALLGAAVASAGDVNGDGFGDVIVGAPGFDSGQSEEGMAFLFLGSASGIGSGDETAADAAIESNQPGALLGNSVASGGDVNGDGFADVLIGAPFYSAPEANEGAAFLFLGSASGISSGSPATAHARFESNQGLLPNFDPGKGMGASVASAGDVNGDGFSDVLIGAPRYSQGQQSEGAAFLFLGSATGIANGTPATANARFESDQQSFCGTIVSFELCSDFGLSVASAGDVNADGYADILIGAPGYNWDETDEGAAFLWLGSATGIANGNPANAHATFESNQGFVAFGDGGATLGQSVSSAGDLNGDGYADIVIGAPGYDVQNPREGSAFVFLGSATGIASGTPATAHVQLERDFAANARMGQSVAAGGDLNGDGYGDILVGGKETNTVLVYLGSAFGLLAAPSEGPNVQLGTEQTGLRYGSAVASAGDVNGDGLDDVLVGARLGGQGGQAFIYHGSEGTGLRRLHAQLPSSIVQVAATGWSIASAGDVNGDGYSDVIVGAPLYDDGETDEGAAFLFHGSASGFVIGGLTATPNTILTSNQVAADFGREVASAGDVNGDGFADVIVGAPLYQNSGAETDEGAAFLFLGSASGIANGNPASAHARIESNQVGAAMGVSAASAGDVNGDGYGDIVVGASLYDNGTADEGAAFVFLGSPSGIADGNPANASAILESNQLPFGAPPPVFSFFGASAASAGDVNGDGYDDVIIGAPGSTNGEIGEGMAVVFLGSATGISSGEPSTASGRIEGNVAQGALGLSVASAGDVNGDGYADVIVGASGFSWFGSDGPVAYVFLGSASGITNAGSPATADAELAHDQRLTQSYAVSVGSAGDMNHDGNSDVFVAANPTSLGFGAFAGSVYMFVGSPAGLGDGNPFSAPFRIFRPYLTVSDPFADLAAAAGDVNGDGFSDFIVGNPPLGSLVYLGNSEGRAVLVRQRRGDGSGLPVQPGGSAYSSSSFIAEITARSASGRERAKVEIQTCPVGSPWGGPSCLSQTSPTWLDLGTSGAVFNETITGLTPNRSYSWRARVLAIPYASTQPGVVPIVSRGPWFRVQARAMPGDIRTVPEPGIGVGLLAGVLLAAAERASRAGLRRRTVGRRGNPGLGDAQSTYGTERQCALDEKHC